MTEYLPSTFEIRHSLFDIRYSLFHSFFFDQTGCPLAGGHARMKLQMFGTVGRATVPAETGRHSGRPYDSTSQSFFLDLTGGFFGQRRRLYETTQNLTANRRISNIEPQNVEGWYRFAQSF